MLCALLVSAITAPAQATVFHARDEIRSLAFPDAERMEPRDYFLTSSQREQIESRARTRLDSDLVTVYVGLRGDDVLGYAFLDTHMVRTLPETFLIDREGVIVKKIIGAAEWDHPAQKTLIRGLLGADEGQGDTGD